MNELEKMKKDVEELKKAILDTTGVSYKGIKISKYISGLYAIEQFDKTFYSLESAKEFIDELKLGSVLYE